MALTIAVPFALSDGAAGAGAARSAITEIAREPVSGRCAVPRARASCLAPVPALADTARRLCRGRCLDGSCRCFGRPCRRTPLPDVALAAVAGFPSGSAARRPCCRRSALTADWAEAAAAAGWAGTRADRSGCRGADRGGCAACSAVTGAALRLVRAVPQRLARLHARHVRPDAAPAVGLSPLGARVAGTRRYRPCRLRVRRRSLAGGRRFCRDSVMIAEIVCSALICMGRPSPIGSSASARTAHPLRRPSDRRHRRARPDARCPGRSSDRRPRPLNRRTRLPPFRAAAPSDATHGH